MAGNLKADLDSYLNRNKANSTLANLTKNFHLPTLKSPFSGSGAAADEENLLEQENAANSWYNDAKNDCLPSLSKKQRIIGFMVCLGMGVLCFSLASMYLPVLVLYARKFALLFSLGSLFSLSSFSLLWGPVNHVKHLFSKDRLPFTSVYLLTLFGTLYFAMGLQSTVLTVVAATGQVLALLWFVVSYIPGGQTGLAFFSKICSAFCKRTVGSSLPI